ncbi:MAG: RNA 2',3'-cyclic phosphodiesterase [Candidatus Marinimicrobia bacterium]|nr:RNA 2',3'-cyclic phosphodiesterase [Candidatus Neomarinimicrobiota bacterium]
MKPIRTFFAIPLPKKIVSELKRIQNYLKQYDTQIKFVNPENMHITMKFLGNTDWMLIDELSDDLTVRFKEFTKFKLQLNKNGYFPSRGKPRILWTGIEKIPQQMKQIFYFLNSYFSKYSYDESGKRLSPHITQARIKRKLEKKIIENFISFKVEPIIFDVEKIVWFESTRIDNVLTYVPLREYYLKDNFIN